MDRQLEGFTSSIDLCYVAGGHCACTVSRSQVAGGNGSASGGGAMMVCAKRGSRRAREDGERGERCGIAMEVVVTQPAGERIMSCSRPPQAGKNFRVRDPDTTQMQREVLDITAQKTPSVRGGAGAGPSAREGALIAFITCVFAAILHLKHT